MIEKVWAIWITGVLQPSLPQDILLDLGLIERPAMVTRTLDLYAQRPDLADQVQAPGTRLLDVFDRLDRALLILGAPGAGKTTLLLTLARDLLIRAAQDPEHPLPVVFPLSSWATRQRPLADWLVEALSEQYQVPRKTGQAWVHGDQILPLLDGLDEVASEHGPACVAAINTFRQDHGLLPLVVCSREAEYQALGMPLRLQGALVVQPLTRQQVDTYLTQVGQPLAAVCDALQEDPTLWEGLDSPLMLTIVTLAYAGPPGSAFRLRGTLAERRQQLFATYVDRMFQRRSASIPYTRPQTERWLAWLAWQLAQHDQTLFFIEYMQPDWLPPPQRWWPTTGIGVACGLVFGLVFGLVLGLGIGLVFGLVFGLGIGLVGARLGYSTEIRTVETVRWSWSAVRSGLPSTLGGGLVLTLVLGLGIGLSFGLGIGLVVGLGVGLGAGLLGGLKDGFSPGELQTKTVPNEGIHRSARYALYMGLGGGLLGGLGGGLSFGLSFGLGSGLGVGLSAGLLGGLVFGLIFGLIFELVGGLNNGGRACLQHVMLRLWLVRNGTAPWRYAKFLDYATERIFLRKVGGGYLFLHRLLQDYFAARYPDPGVVATEELAGRGSSPLS